MKRPSGNKFTRRRFISGTAAALGSFRQLAAKSMKGTDAKISLVSAEAGRTDVSLRVMWAAVPSAKSYRLSITSVDGRREVAVTTTEYLWSGLAPNTDYDFELSATLDSVIWGPWSEAFQTCTRPPTPSPPVQIFGDMTNPGIVGHISWNASAAIAGVRRADGIRVLLGREAGSGVIEEISDAKIHKALPVSGEYKDEATLASPYRVQLIAANSRAPARLNRSAWSERLVTASVYFGTLQVPGVSSACAVSAEIMRDYYA
jgi:hypothetical protein